MIEFIIQHGNQLYAPEVLDDLEWSTERKGVPGKLQFKVIKDDVLQMEEGDAVRFKSDGFPIFYGFIFTMKYEKDDIITVMAYDQLRYLKNKDTYVYENKTASELIRLLAADFRLQTGIIENSNYVIPSRVEDNSTLFDIILNALDLTLIATGQLYVLFDDFGKLSLRNMESMKLDFLLDETTGENFKFSSSIDDKTYNKIKLTHENKETKKREIYVVQDGKNINRWGVLQKTDTLQEGEDGKEKANAMLSLFNKKIKNLSIENAFGDNRVRAGSMIVVSLDLGNTKVQNWMIVEKCKHEYSENEHTMTLTLRGGGFDA